MSKIYSINIGKDFYNKILIPIRENFDIIELLLESIQLFLIDQSYGPIYPDHDITKHGTMTFVINKMSRIIYEVPCKIFSFNFPFTIVEDIEKKIMTVKDSALNINLDSFMVSILIGFFERGLHQKSYYEEFFCEFEDYLMLQYEGDTVLKEMYPANDVWRLISKLLKFESGYLRYDYDEQHHDEYYHPLNHLDLFYSSNATFKLGLNRGLTKQKFIDIIDNQNPRYFLNDQ